ncbi:tripartite tricarboxylate transporter TctB family protein [Rhizobium puerariae]|uniref:Tripartite tricarboxylate transporter TctB family protein n=1 Tax=Rhizobium puerariae TaxID=1585791 RepID=A0ABV6ABE4_9HYPH
MVISDIRDLLGGALLVLIGGATAIAAQQYGIGSATNTEPGFFPMILACLLLLVGAGVMLSALDFRGTKPKGDSLRFDLWHLWCLVVVAGGFALFGLLLPVAGLFVTCFVAIAAIGFGSRLLTPVGALTVALVLAVVAVVLFRYLLDLQVQAWPWGG